MYVSVKWPENINMVEAGGKIGTPPLLGLGVFDIDIQQKHVYACTITLSICCQVDMELPFGQWFLQNYTKQIYLWPTFINLVF